MIFQSSQELIKEEVIKVNGSSEDSELSWDDEEKVFDWAATVLLSDYHQWLALMPIFVWE